MEIKIAKYSMILLTLIFVIALILGGHFWGIDKGKLIEKVELEHFLKAQIGTTSSPANDSSIDPDCLTEEGC